MMFMLRKLYNLIDYAYARMMLVLLDVFPESVISWLGFSLVMLYCVIMCRFLS